MGQKVDPPLGGPAPREARNRWGLAPGGHELSQTCQSMLAEGQLLAFIALRS